MSVYPQPTAPSQGPDVNPPGLYDPKGNPPVPNQPQYWAQGQQQPPMVPGYGYQPPMQSTTTVILQQPGAEAQKLLMVPVQGVRDWTSGLCGCFEDIGSCMCVWCCPVCAACQVASRQGDCCCMPLCLCSDPNPTLGVTNTSLVAMRARIRTLGGVRGSIMNDCCAVCCCPQCTLCQMDRELKAMGL